MTLKNVCTIVVAALACVVAPSCLQAEVLVTNTSTWKYLHPTDGVDPAKADADFHTTFFQASFDDAGWKSGKDAPGEHGGFAYGEEDFEGVDIGKPDEENRKTAYFRLKFTTKAAAKDLALKCQRDDGIIIYLDGKEVARDNMDPKAKEAYDLMATGTVGEAETEVHVITIPGELAAGEHILAISLHNRASADGAFSSDLRLAEVSLESDVKPAAKPATEKPAAATPAK